MKDSLKTGIEHELVYKVPTAKTVPALYPESREFQSMPEVFATGFMVGLIEWACIQAVNPHINWPFEQTVGTHINVSHTSATPPGLVVRVKAKLIQIQGRKLVFEVEARDELDLISKGTLERFVVDAEKFRAKAAEKLRKSRSLRPRKRMSKAMHK